jgi:PAS domain S-box-containing protein
LELVIENLPNMVFVKDAKTLRFVRFNRAGEELLGHSRKILLGKNDYDFFPPEQADFFTAKDRSVLVSGKPTDIPEEPLSTARGLRYLHTKKIPVMDSQGKPAFLLGISEDITDVKRREQESIKLAQEQIAREEAEKSAKRLQFLAEASAILHASLNLKENLHRFVELMIKDFADWCEVALLAEDGLSVEEFFIANEDPEKVKWALDFRKNHSLYWLGQVGTGHTLQTGQPEIYKVFDMDRIEKQLSDPARRESIRLLNVHSAMFIPLIYYENRIGVMTFGRNKIKESYDDIDASLAMDLGRRVAMAVENARWFQKAKEASEAKSAFLANMSHEIRTPLGAMLGFAELLEESELTQQQRNYLSTILKNGRQLLNIVDEILDLSKAESDRITVDEVEFSILSLIEEVRSLLDVQAKERELEFNVQVSPRLPSRLITDPLRLRQILINVIGNAIKFTNEGLIDVGIDLVFKPEGPFLEIRVRDTGIGISDEQREKLFQPFSQADSSMARRFGGTGLGLSLARRMARLLGGDVILESSQTDNGSQFVITLGVQIPSETARETEVSAPQGLAEDQLPNQGKVLIVDDAPDNRMLIQHYVSRLGYSADTAETGREAVERALNEDFDVILMDVQMPEMDGFEAVRELRQQSYHKPIVALTAHTMKGDREKCLEGGFDDFLGKPVDRDQLRRSLERYSVHP